MSKGALKELLSSSPEKFHLMVKNAPVSEKPEILHSLQKRLSQLENLQ